MDNIYIVHNESLMPASRIQIAKADIVEFFSARPTRVYTLTDIDHILNQQRSFWRLAQRMTKSEFIRFLIKTGKLHEIDTHFPSRTDIRYIWNEAPILELAQSLRPRSYISHYAAVKAHGLTDQVPKTIYINSEQQLRSDPDALLDPSRVKAAFSRPQRLSAEIADMEDYRVCVLHGQNTGNAGVVTQEVPDIYTNLTATIRITNLERTLIDIAVRPAYSGGVSEVLNAYKAAFGQASVNRIAALLKQIGYVYPYHQAIGFYLSRAGFRSDSVQLLKQFPITMDFYLTHEMRETDYVAEWRLHIPRGF